MNASFRTVEVSDPRFELEGLRFVTVKSPALGRRADLLLHIPQCAEERADAPLVILLHGVYGSHWSWVFNGGAHLTNSLVSSWQTGAPLILAMPSDGLWGDGSAYFRHGDGPDYEQWIVEEVPAAAAKVTEGLVTDRSPLFIAGLSMGGFGALRLAAKHPRRFRAVGAHSAITHFDQMAQFVEEDLSAYAAREEDRCVASAMLANRTALPLIRFDCGIQDPLLPANRALSARLREHGVPHEYHEFPGGHEWRYWEKRLSDTLEFFVKCAGGEGTAPFR